MADSGVQSANDGDSSRPPVASLGPWAPTVLPMLTVGCRVAWAVGACRIANAYSGLPRNMKHSLCKFCHNNNNNNNNNNNTELIERFRNLKALYNLKKNIHCTHTHNYTNQ